VGTFFFVCLNTYILSPWRITHLEVHFSALCLCWTELFINQYRVHCICKWYRWFPV
jgi:hypothetical protein